MKQRSAEIERNTLETQVKLKLNLSARDGNQIVSGVGFLDHMLGQIVRHAGLSLSLQVKGDLHIDAHHTVEDIGICLGEALNKALANRMGIQRFASSYAPLDESLSRAVVDLSNRPHLTFKAKFNAYKVGDFEVELVQEFFQALVNNARMTLHLENLYGINTHHQIESMFKAFALALKQAIAINDDNADLIPSTKGVL